MTLVSPSLAPYYPSCLAFANSKKLPNRFFGEPGGDVHLSYLDNLIEGELGCAATTHVLSMGYDLKVVGVNAISWAAKGSAKMVKFRAFGNLSLGLFIVNAVRHAFAYSRPPAVSIDRYRSLPYPARRVVSAILFCVCWVAIAKVVSVDEMQRHTLKLSCISTSLCGNASFLAAAALAVTVRNVGRIFGTQGVTSFGSRSGWLHTPGLLYVR